MKLGRYRLFDRFVIPNLDRPDELYLTRWRVVETPWAGLFLHRFDGPDSRPTLHDHPWAFVSIIVRGGYHEIRLRPTTRDVCERRIRFVNVMRRDDAHYIDRLDRTPTWSLVIVGKRRRVWGYWRRLGNAQASWTWTPFDTDVHGTEMVAALAERAA